jgi:hypothetical protein
MNDTTCDKGIGLLDRDEDDNEESFAFRAALLSEVQGFHIAHEPGSRADFIQALQQLGAEPKVSRLQNHRNTRRMVHVHVSCSYNNWIKIFGEPVCIEEIRISTSKSVLHRWKHFCSDGSVTCVGQLFEQSPGVSWIVLMRVMIF